MVKFGKLFHNAKWYNYMAISQAFSHERENKLCNAITHFKLCNALSGFHTTYVFLNF